MAVSETFQKPSSMLYRNFLAMETEEMLRSHPVDSAVFSRHITQADRGCDFDFLHAGPPTPDPEIH